MIEALSVDIGCPNRLIRFHCKDSEVPGSIPPVASQGRCVFLVFTFPYPSPTEETSLSSWKGLVGCISASTVMLHYMHELY